ncbi:MAG: hypothetical protein SF123_16445 [Chloroflexota bacterium]|nr:hypothetical protein [Chloroflexota bacterium]
MNRPISTRMHGIIDLIYGFGLLLAPNLLGFKHHKIPSAVARAFGGSALLVSLLTRYEFGIFKIVPMRVHLILDVVKAALLAASPYLLGFHRRRRNAWLPHVIAGLASLPIPLLTQPVSPVETQLRLSKRVEIPVQIETPASIDQATR